MLTDYLDAIRTAIARRLYAVIMRLDPWQGHDGPRQRIRPRAEICIDAYRVVEEAVESGVRWGWHRAHKYVDDPSEDAICDAISDAVQGELCEWMRFDVGDEP